MKVYGDAGKPMLVFPCQGGRFAEFEDFGMLEVCRPFIEDGKLKVFTIDSVDNQSWANADAPPAQRARRHEDYDRYVTKEVAPFIGRAIPGGSRKILTFGCSMGGYHAGNFFFRHPEIIDAMICLSGLFQLRLFVGDYVDDNVYFNSPLYYLSNLSDEKCLARYRSGKIIICVGQGAWEQAMIADAQAMRHVLAAKSIPAWIDFWGYDVNHDWPWWRKQLPYFLGHLLT